MAPPAGAAALSVATFRRRPSLFQHAPRGARRRDLGRRCRVRPDERQRVQSSRCVAAAKRRTAVKAVE
eukprot:6642890-Prymnesium_polylepis.1